ncbi:hypothetical protein CMV_016831 [Castanea mollissima]|uniref:GRIP domain-containing protein n=1 Tax=Castanea mollissima TaxID=60419 RepID=A0A8J4QYZ7_9ROSI|nr:hypothetical protein CMV_016831 [Castanea mollissima]
MQAQELSEAQQKLDQEIKDREEKYSELDSKFCRLHKRAKQRIQDVQKEKDDLEVRFREVSETAERASSQQSALQQELERTRQQANDALKAMDAERQQLRSTNNKLRDTIEELRRSVEPKESALEALQQSLMEKEQMLEDMRGLLQAADEKRQASIAELSAKHQKNLESLEAQLADALSDRSKATETISSLQVLIAEKESKIAEMDAASTGEAARFRASVESIKGELAHLKREHLLARQQAQREEELAQSQRHILALQEEIEELERENRLHSQQEAMLKTELRNMERMQKREGVDMTYLKNVILKLLETGEVEALLPVIGMLLQFSPEEIHKCQQAYRASTDVPPSPASDGPGSRSLFSRFSFS